MKSKNNFPLVTIVIPTKDRETKLQRLLKSLEVLTYPKNKLEIIVINNGSEFKSLLNNVKIIQNNNNTGLANARNQGAELAKGKYVLFIDDDNEADEHMIIELVNTLERHQNILAVGPLTFYKSNKRKIWFAGSRVNMLTTIPWFRRSFSQDELIKGSLLLTENLHNCFMLRKNQGQAVGWFDKNVFMSGTEFDLFQRMKKKQPQFILTTNVSAICYHNVPEFQSNLLRSLGFDNKQRVYYFQRNRGLHIGKYGKWYHKAFLFLVMYPIFLVGYSLLFLGYGRWDFIKEHGKATVAGYYYLIKG